MDSLVLVIIAATAFLSYKGFTDVSFFTKNMFSVGAIQQRKEYYRLITSGFLHANWMHLILNMYVLYIFASPVIHLFGVPGFLIIYFASIVFGNLFSLFVYKHNPGYNAIGASGGVSGIIFAAIAMVPDMGIGVLFIPFYAPGYIFGALYFAYSVYMMLNPKHWDNLGHAAHLGGAAVGLVYAILVNFEGTVEHAREILIMSLPLVYLGYRLFSGKRIS